MRVLRVCVIAMVATIALTAAPGGAEPYRLVILPDWQWATATWPDLLTTTTRWIVAHREALNIRYVLQVGDLVADADDREQWRRASDALAVLDGNVPYIVAAGNRDAVGDAGWSLANFNAFFPLGRFEGRPSFGGSYPAGTNDNSYHRFAAGGTDWLVVSLHYRPDADELAWARSVVEAHPDSRVVILTHDYVFGGGRSAVGESIWNGLARRYGNIAMVVAGHKATAHRQGIGDSRNRVHEMAFDWEDASAPGPNSLVALLEVDPDAGTMAVTSYSPWLQTYFEGPSETFELDTSPVPPLPSVFGDANLDGFVDDNDLSVLLVHWGRQADWTEGEFSGEGPVNDNDLSLLLVHWTGLPPTATVPEPATGLLAAGALGWYAISRRRTGRAGLDRKGIR